MLNMEKINIGNPIKNTKSTPNPPLRIANKEVNMNNKLELDRKHIALIENPKCILFRR